MAQWRQCQGTTKAGAPCRAAALPGTDPPNCVFHSPAHAELRQAGRRRGGQTHSRQAVLPDAPDVEVRTVGDLTLFLSQTLSQTRRGELDAKVCNALVYGASVLLRVLVGQDQEQQILELQRLAREHEERVTT